MAKIPLEGPIDFPPEVPSHIQPGIQLWIQNGIPPGDFLTAVLNNDLRESFGRADHTNRYALFEIVKWLWNNAPSPCWGDPDRVKQWAEVGGLVGLTKKEQKNGEDSEQN
jgi:hypothetical protein